MRIFVAGASGVIGQELIPILVGNGHDVLGMTRSEDKAEAIKAHGAEAVVCDVYNFQALQKVVSDFAPEVIIDELTDLPDDPSLIPKVGKANARIRREGTRNLLSAIEGQNNVRFICQSVAWQLPGDSGLAVSEMEQMVLDSSGVVIRYGQFYGAGTYYPDSRPEAPRIEIKKAAQLTLGALSLPSAIYVAEDSSNSLTRI